MARYKDNDKNKKKAGKGYGDPPPAPEPGYQEHGGHKKYGGDGGYGQKPPVIEAEVIRRGTLEVVVSGADDKRLAGVEITITGDNFKDIVTTGPNGETLRTGLDRQVYSVAATPPEGYDAPDPVEADLTNTDQEVTIVLEPREAILRVLAFYDAKRTCDPLGQAPIGGAGFEIFSGEQSLGWFQTGPQGFVDVPVSKPGLIRILPDRTVQTGPRQLQNTQGAGVFVQVAPGGSHGVDLAYVESRGELEVSATFLKESQFGNHLDNQEVPFGGVWIELYAGTAPVGKFLRRLLIESPAPLDLGDLEAGNYVLVAKGPASHQGHAIELYDPASGSMTVSLPAGGSIPLPPFRFRCARGRVVGFVLEANTQKGHENVGLLLSPKGDGATHHAVTGDGGEFAFHDVPAGAYELSLDDLKITAPDGSEWVLAPGMPKSQTVLVQPGKTNYLPPIFLVLDEHLLNVSVLDAENHPVGNVEVDVLDEQNNFVGSFPVDDCGKVTIRVARSGMYQVGLGVHETGVPRQAAQRVYVNQPADAIIRIGRFGMGGGPGGGGGGGVPREAVVDIPYPLLTEGAMTIQGGWPSSSSAPSTADLGQTVQNALREVLNWRPSDAYGGGAKGFVAALNQSFTIRQIEGHTEFTWTPRSYAAVQTGLGALTGAQASIYTRAKVALDQVLPLLEGLYPLRADSDPQDTEAIRAIVRSGFTELVNELGVEGGPRVLRVDDLFRQLVDTTNPDPELVRGQLGQLASLFGLQRTRVNTIDEEQNLTNFLIVADYVLGLQQSWLTQRRFFTRGGGSEPFLGTQLVLVERSLSVVSESVQEVYLAMDSVFLGREERQVVELTFPGEPPLFVAELLSWIDQVASTEGPQLIKDGGKQGVISFQPTIDRLARLAAGALVPPQNPADLPAGYRTARVQRALQELADHLEETSNLVQQIRQRTAA